MLGDVGELMDRGEGKGDGRGENGESEAWQGEREGCRSGRLVRLDCEVEREGRSEEEREQEWKNRENRTGEELKEERGE